MRAGEENDAVEERCESIVATEEVDEELSVENASEELKGRLGGDLNDGTEECERGFSDSGVESLEGDESRSVKEEAEDVLADNKCITLKVKQIDGKCFEFTDLALSTSIEELKEMIQAKTEVAPENQRIIHHGKVLHTGSLLDHKVKDESWIHLVFRDPNVSQANNSNGEGASQTEETGSRAQPLEEVTNSLTAILSTALRASTRGSGQASQRNQANPPHPLAGAEFNLEHLWQSLRTIDNLATSYEEIENNRTRDVAEETQKEDELMKSVLDDEDLAVGSVKESELDASDSPELPSIRRFECGQWVDVLDTVNQWLEATVMNVSPDGMKIKVHYNAWGERWDEVIDVRSERIAPFRTKTKHRSAQNLSATPVTWVTNRHKINNGGLDELLASSAESLERILPIIRDAASAGSAGSNIDRLLYLAPLMDRAGRMLADTASKLAQRPRLVPCQRVIPVWPFSALGQSILPFDLYIPDNDGEGKERQRLLRSRGLDADFLQMINQPLDNDPLRGSNLDIHIHAIVSPGQVAEITNATSGTASSD